MEHAFTIQIFCAKLGSVKKIRFSHEYVQKIAIFGHFPPFFEKMSNSTPLHAFARPSCIFLMCVLFGPSHEGTFELWQIYGHYEKKWRKLRFCVTDQIW